MFCKYKNFSLYFYDGYFLDLLTPPSLSAHFSV